MTTTISKYHPTTVDWGMILSSLNTKFKRLEPEARLARLFDLFRDSDILVTTSFGSKSIYLLHLLKKIKPDHPVYFVDTGFHFPETMIYMEKMVSKMNINLQILKPDPVQHTLTADESWWNEHPNMCCTINKIAPLEPVVESHKVWISSLMKGQTKRRARLEIFNKQGTILKFHPIIDLDESDFNRQVQSLNLESHPLVNQGYHSIGCSHCTQKGTGRSGRWNGTSKTECGLHTRFYTGRNEK